MFHEQPWHLIFLAILLHDKRKGELAEDDGFEVPLGFVVSRRTPDEASQRQIQSNLSYFMAIGGSQNQLIMRGYVLREIT